MLLDFDGHDQDTRSGPQVSYSDFRNLYPIYHFDLEKQTESIADSVIDIHIKARFSEQKDYRAYAVVLSDKILYLQGDGMNLNII